jgi:hypothetical protein
VVTIKGYKFQAMVKPLAGGDGTPVEFDDELRRIVVHADASVAHGDQMFNALVCGEGNMGSYTIVTLRLEGDDVGDYLGVGEHFRLWLGDDVAEGVITHKLWV